ncbi:MAG: hypothetical protein ACI4PC_00705, partial [Oscillospiraceae bacterium]
IHTTFSGRQSPTCSSIQFKSTLLPVSAIPFASDDPIFLYAVFRNDPILLFSFYNGGQAKSIRFLPVLPPKNLPRIHK